MIVYQVEVRDKETKELIEIGHLFASEELAEKQKKHLLEVYSDPDVSIRIRSERVLEEYEA